MINDLDIVQWAYLLDPAFQIVNTAGKPLTDGWIEVYIHGTRNKYYCASDFDGTLHPFKIPLDSLGSNIVLASPDYAYDVYIYNKFGSLVMSRYNVKAGAAGGGSGGMPSQYEAQHWLGQYGATQALIGNQTGQTLALPSNPDYQGDFIDHIDYGLINGDETNEYPKYMYLKPGLYLVNCVIRFQQQLGTEVNRLDETLVYTGNGNANEDVAWQLDETGPLTTGDRHCLKLTFIRKVLDEGETSPVDCSNILYFAPGPSVNWNDAYIQTLQIVKLNSAVQGGGGAQLLKPGPGISIDEENEISVTGMQPVSGMDQYVTVINFNDYITEVTEVINNVTGDIINIQNEIEQVSASVSAIVPEYEAGYGIVIEDDTISVDPSIIPSGCVSQEELAQVTGDIVNQIENVTGDVTNIITEISNVTGDIVNINENVTNLTEVVNGVTGDIEQLNADIQAVSAALPDAQVQSDWDESNPDSKAFILNKPDLNVYATKDEVGSATSVLQSEIEAVTGNPLEQVQSDWTQVDDTQVDYIKNKPEETEVIAGPGISIVESGSTVTISATGQATVEDLAQVNADIQTVSAAIPDISNLATKDSVQAVEHDVQVVSSAIPDISNLATKDEVQSVEDDVQTVSAAIPDISNLATKDEVNAVENDLQTVSAAVDSVSASIPETEEVEFEELDLSQFAQASAVTAIESQIQTVSSAIPDVSDFVTHGELAAVTGDYATNEDLQTVSAAIPDISNLATESEVQFVSGAIEAVSAGIPAAQVQSDWTQTATGEPDYIKNKPNETPLIAGQNIVIEDVQNGIQISATVPPVTGFATEADLQTVSAAVDSVSAAIPEYEEIEFEELDLSQFVTESAVTGLEEQIQTVSSAIPDVSNLASKSEVQAVADDLQIVSAAIPDVSNFATESDLQTVSAAIPDPQVNADWNATSGVAEILNKPEIVEMSVANIIAGENVSITASGDDYVISASGGSNYNAGQYISIENNEIAVTGLQPEGDYATNADLQTVSAAIPDVSDLATEADLQTVSAAIPDVSDLATKQELEAVSAAVPEAQVNADWTAVSGKAEILNKPTESNLIAGQNVTIAVSGDDFVISAAGGDASTFVTREEFEEVTATIPEPQVNADWNATSGVAEILNKPAEVNLIAGSNITITESGANLVISSTGGGSVTGDYVTYPELAAVTGDVAQNASDIQTVSGAVDEVSGKIPESEEVEFEELDLSQYVTESAVTGLEAEIQTVSAAIPDVSNLATKTEVGNVEADVQTVSAAIPDVSNFITQTAMENYTIPVQVVASSAAATGNDILYIVTGA
jgi:hypothetical protein